MHVPNDPVIKPVAAPFLAAILAEPVLEARRMAVGEGEEIHSEDAPAQNVYLIHRGQVRLYQHGSDQSTRLVEILGPDEWFGVGALAQASTYGVRAMAVVPTVVSEVLVDRLLEALAQRPQVFTEVTRELACRLMTARDDASRLTFDDCNQRLINTLIRFSQTAASTAREDGVVLHITHSQLAQAVGAARETVSLALTQLRHRNLLRTGRNQLFFKPEDLRRVSCDDLPADRVA